MSRILPSAAAHTLRSVIRLRTLSEAEVWARCYGSYDPTVRIVRVEPRRPRYDLDVSGESLRASLEARLDERLAEQEAA